MPLCGFRADVLRRQATPPNPWALMVMAWLWVAAVTSAWTAANEPTVVGFQRFHSSEASAAGGRLLWSELSCGACHVAKSMPAPKGGPVLDGIGRRVSAQWLRAYLSDPQAVKPGATMPHVLAGVTAAQRDVTVDVLVHFLMSQTQPLVDKLKEDKDASLDASSAQRGRDLYHAVGCVACHDPDASETEFFLVGNATDTQAGDEDEEEGDGRVTGRPRVRVGRAPSVPLPRELERKYGHRTLTQFLMQPHRFRPAGRMPDLQLDLLSAADIAHYLLKGRPDSPPAFLPDPKKVAQGLQVFTGLGCAACHTLGQNQWRHAGRTPDLSELRSRFQNGDRGAPQKCLADTARGAFPFYGLSLLQTQSLTMAMAENERDSLSHTLAAMNCYACHARQEPAEPRSLGGVGERRRDFFRTVASVGEVDLGDEGRLPPDLTRVGLKLRATWLEQVIQGKTRLRPHMTLRMPGFPKRVATQIAAQLVEYDTAALEGESYDALPRIPTGKKAEMVEAGRSMMNLGCVQCHPIRGRRLAGVVGVDVHRVYSRMQWPWFHDFLLDPNARKPGTRMPTFFRNGKSSAPNILDGDPELQILAIWTYLNDAKADLPDRIRDQQKLDFELRPTERPIVLRTFMKQAGTHAIAVGFPSRVHFAFDAEQCRLAEVWRGRFLDAHSTWYDRFTPPAKPLAESTLILPTGSPFTRLAPRGTTSLAAQWSGYRLDEDEIPVFLYRVADSTIEDKLQPTDDGRLQRTLAFEGASSGVWIRLAKGAPIGREGDWLRVGGLQLRIADKSERARRMGDEILFPLFGGEEDASKESVTVEYQW